MLKGELLSRTQLISWVPPKLICKVILVKFFLNNLSTKARDCRQFLLMIQSCEALSIEQG